MLQLMLCGAHDLEDISKDFYAVAQDFGAEPWFYQGGRVLHMNSRTSDWTKNSRATVRKADACVFVFLEQYGDTTWEIELEEALDLGKPFVVLALERTKQKIDVLRHSLSDGSAIASPNDRRMVELWRRLDSESKLTVATFSTHSAFGAQLRTQLGDLFQQTLELAQTRNQRAALAVVLAGNDPLSRGQLERAMDLVRDEFEPPKRERKDALRRLAREGVRNHDLLIDACRSTEQGLQRLAYDLLANLIPLPVDVDSLIELAHIASRADDVGLARRFVTSVGNLDPTTMDVVLDALGATEEGVRRRAFEAAETHLPLLREQWGEPRLDRFLETCEARTSGRLSWTHRLKNLRNSLSADPD